MAVTIQQIADRAGVSRGTVDRALNHRGRINSEVAERICQIAEEMGYHPRPRKNGTIRQKIKIGVIIQLAKSSFVREITRGIDQAKKELENWGVELLIREGQSVDEREQAAAIDDLVRAGIQGLAIMPVDCDLIREYINRLVEEQHIPVVTFNSDIVGTRRCCFVGMDNKKSGSTAAGLLGMLTRGSGKILIITGFFSNPANNMRVDGFVSEIKNTYPDITIAGVQGSFDEAGEVERIIETTLINTTGINGILLVSGGQSGVRAAFEKLHLEKRPYVVIYDLIPESREALKNNTADFLLDQNGYIQGYRPPYILANMLSKGVVPQEEYQFTDINIKTRFNL